MNNQLKKEILDIVDRYPNHQVTFNGDEIVIRPSYCLVTSISNPNNPNNPYNLTVGVDENGVPGVAADIVANMPIPMSIPMAKDGSPGISIKEDLEP